MTNDPNNQNPNDPNEFFPGSYDPNQNNTNPYGQTSGYGATNGMPYEPYSGQQDASGNYYAAGQQGLLLEGTGKAEGIGSIGYGFKVMSRSGMGVWAGATFLVGLIFAIIVGVFSFTVFNFLKGANPDSGITNPDTVANASPDELTSLLESNSMMTQGMNVVTFGVTILTSVVAVFFAAAALKAVNGEKIGFGSFFKNQNLGKAIVFDIVLSLVVTGVKELIVFSAGGAMGPEAAASFGTIMNFVFFLITPLYFFMVYYILDRGASVAEALREGFAAGLHNYLQLIVVMILFYLIGIVAIIPFGLGLLFVLPAGSIAFAAMYRQASGGTYVNAA